MSKKFLFGFTLAELLIALTIVGIIASLTIPVTVQQMQDAQLRVAWKDGYSMLNQVVNKVILDYGSLKGLCPNNDSNCLREKFKPYLNYIKSCDQTAAKGVCWHKNGSYFLMNGTAVDSGWYEEATLVLNNGYLLQFWYPNSSCTEIPSGGTIKICGDLTVDINGFKGPNTIGRDIFVARMFENGIKPQGIAGDDVIPSTDCKSTGMGFACSLVYLTQ